MAGPAPTPRPNDTDDMWVRADSCDLDEFRSLVETTAEIGGYPFADRIDQGTVVYDSRKLRERLQSPRDRRAVMAEIAAALSLGPGIAVFESALEEGPIDAATNVFKELILVQNAAGRHIGDHFAKPGANDRIWNAQEKFALRDPEAFAAYFANDIIALASEAWLGPAYQVTSQVNVVNPGGSAQSPHRDYHLGFLTDAVAERFPAHVHRLSPILTLQGAVAHCDMPVETGPTLYLPHSQKYLPGYLAWRRSNFIEYFGSNHVQLPLRKGDAVFFNPALFHAAGQNRTADVRRMANLLQVSSALGRAMESVDRRAMSLRLYPTLQAMKAAGADHAAIDRVIAASAEGYAFPGDLDVDQPLDGLAPPSMADKVQRALADGWPLDQLRSTLEPT